MVFSSVIFLHYFLPFAIVAGVGSHQLFGPRVSNPVLLILSLIFYSWGIGITSLWLLLTSTAVNYLLALMAQHARGGKDDTLGKIVGVATIVFNVGILVFFKYANFIVAETAPLRHLLGLSPWAWEIVALPIGVSFFTFHSLSYVWDVKSGRSSALRNPLDLALYICIFPQLIAGPIVRFHAIEAQLSKRNIGLSDLGDGSLRFLHGLAKKVIIADPAGAIADQCFGAAPDNVTLGVAWLGAAAYTVQIYFDFSGYTDMAIGLARLFGFRFPENFDRPYASQSISEFWRRWHISLSSWFRDYVYIPLGGSRASERRTIANLLTIFMLTGFWHGANWTFLVWGLYHGGLVILERLTGTSTAQDVARSREQTWLDYVARRLTTMILVIVGWVFFRAEDLPSAIAWIAAMFSPGLVDIPSDVRSSILPDDAVLLALGIGLCLLPARLKAGNIYHSERSSVRLAAITATVLLAFPVALIRIASASFSPFLYFQF